MFLRVLALLLGWLVLAACGPSRASEERLRPWTVGFWYWDMWGSPDRLEAPVDSVYVLARGGLPAKVPDAKEYWLVYRYERQAVPKDEAAATLINDVGRGLSAARQRGLPVRGVQFDIDSPTAALPQYAGFLREARRELPRGMELSITALLDWFRAGTAVGDVIREVDEFVPQFYDIADPERSGPAIAAPIDGVRWGPVFNRFKKPFRIGISTFGRARGIRNGQSLPRYYFDRVMPLDLAVNSAFQLQARRNPAAELVLTWRAARATKLGYERFEAGDAVEFIVPTGETVRVAVEAARRIGGQVAGVIFFRWANAGEALSFHPTEALAAAGSRAPDGARYTIRAVDRGCAAVSCVDLFFEGAAPWSPDPLRRRIVSSARLSYFLPEKDVPVRMAGASAIELSMPPYCARGRIYLGRAVSDRPVEFRIEELP